MTLSNGDVKALYTTSLAIAPRFAFCIGAKQNRASLVHMRGGPDVTVVNWQAMVAGMPIKGGTFFAILANSAATALSSKFLIELGAHLPHIPKGNKWVYNQTKAVDQLRSRCERPCRRTDSVKHQCW